MLKVYAFGELVDFCHHGERVHFVVFPAAPETTCCSTSRCGRGCTRKSLTLGPCCASQATGKEPCNVVLFAYRLSLFVSQKCQVNSLRVLSVQLVFFTKVSDEQPYNVINSAFLHKSVR